MAKPTIRERINKLPLELQVVIVEDIETAIEDRLIAFEKATVTKEKINEPLYLLRSYA